MKCCVHVSSGETEHIVCDRVAHRSVGRKGFCEEHTKEAFEASSNFAKTRQTKEERLWPVDGSNE